MKIQPLVILLILLLIISACKNSTNDASEEVAQGNGESQPTENFCGDNICQSDENECTCEQDCGACSTQIDGCKAKACDDGRCITKTVSNCCGNKQCEPGEYTTCEEDCSRCNDKDACTSDTFDYDKKRCDFQPLAHCCGNDICEEEESCSTCFEDCKCETQYTLKDYPTFFEHFKISFVVGKDASSNDVVLLTNTISASGLTGSAVLDTELPSLTGKNIIALGDPCENSVIYRLLKTDKDCHDILKANTGLIQLIPTSENSFALVIAGEGKSEKELAAQVISDYSQYDLPEDDILWVDQDFVSGAQPKETIKPSSRTSSSNDLSGFPFMFLKDNITTLIIVISDDPENADLEAATGIKKAITKTFEEQTNADITITINSSDTIDEITEFNAIIIGSPFVNPITNWFYNRYTFQEDHPQDAYIRLYQNKTKRQVLLAALDEADIRSGAKVLEKPDDFLLNGTILNVHTEDNTISVEKIQ